jgi:hypothetical protein
MDSYVPSAEAEMVARKVEALTGIPRKLLLAGYTRKAAADPVVLINVLPPGTPNNRQYMALACPGHLWIGLHVEIMDFARTARPVKGPFQSRFGSHYSCLFRGRELEQLPSVQHFAVEWDLREPAHAAVLPQAAAATEPQCQE